MSVVEFPIVASAPVEQSPNGAWHLPGTYLVQLAGSVLKNIQGLEAP
jgi:hypothetical protein